MDILMKYYPGISRISPELAQFVIDRAGGRCEICEMERGEEIHHLVGRRRVAHPENLLFLCRRCHRKIHQSKELREKYLLIYQDWCFAQGYNEEQVRHLMGTKSGKLI